MANGVTNIKLVGRNIDITTELKNYINKKLENIQKYVHKISSLEVVVGKQKYMFDVEILIHTYNKKIVKLTAKNKSLWTAIDNVVSKLKDTLVKYKDKIVSKKKHVVKNYTPPLSEEIPYYIKNVIVAKKMNEKEAVETIKNSEKQTIVFFNTDTNKLSMASKNQQQIEITDIEIE